MAFDPIPLESKSAPATPNAYFRPIPVSGISGGGGGAVEWDDITDKPAVIAAGATQADARTAIGAGTSSLVIGTTATTAKAGNAVQTATQTTATAIAPGTATNVQAILAELAARITALENA